MYAIRKVYKKQLYWVVNTETKTKTTKEPMSLEEAKASKLRLETPEPDPEPTYDSIDLEPETAADINPVSIVSAIVIFVSCIAAAMGLIVKI